LLRSAHDGAVVELAPTGPLLGVDESARFGQRSLRLAPGDFALLYTDGVTEAICDCVEDNCFGEERLRDLVADAGAGPAGFALTRLTAAVADFTGPTPPFDDITAVGIKRVA
jgi:serine phosphatase RsbU (regulator of sigma subunit)